MRLGIFGGTFDPPHVGHLLAASDAIEQLALDRLAFVPAAVQPLKASRSTALGVHRLEMLRLTVSDDPRLETDSVELDRDGLSYTVDTLREFARRHPSAERYFLVGADVLSSFAQWRDPKIVLELATLAVLTRRSEGETSTAPRLTAEMDAEVARRSTVVPTRRIDVSSTEIRERVRTGRSIHGFVTDDVAGYISSHGLYR
ncbi:MAG TPA: nicotinate-nucleotide adenylyltransferase [Gemmatimonadaceae bacterium]|nr:nicotinate-nucleotide adenylyltransferase [Gemmatimonadaceae bacterium]